MDWTIAKFANVFPHQRFVLYGIQKHLMNIQLGISIIDTVDFYRPCATETVEKSLLYRH